MIMTDYWKSGDKDAVAKSQAVLERIKEATQIWNLRSQYLCLLDVQQMTMSKAKDQRPSNTSRAQYPSKFFSLIM
jgi:hypothetical protein